MAKAKTKNTKEERKGGMGDTVSTEVENTSSDNSAVMSTEVENTSSDNSAVEIEKEAEKVMAKTKRFNKSERSALRAKKAILNGMTTKDVIREYESLMSMSVDPDSDYRIAAIREWAEENNVTLKDKENIKNVAIILYNHKEGKKKMKKNSKKELDKEETKILEQVVDDLNSFADGDFDDIITKDLIPAFGKIKDAKTYKDLKEWAGKFAEILQDYWEEDDEDEDDEDDLDDEEI